MLQLLIIIFLVFSLTDRSLVAPKPARSITAYQSVYAVRDDGSDKQAASFISYCALLKSPKRYAGKLVRIKASWQFGFETSFLYDQKCPQHPKAWLEFADEKEVCPETKTNRNAPAQSDKEAAVTVVGRLYGPGRYGHLGAYEFKFVVVCLEDIKITSSDIR